MLNIVNNHKSFIARLLMLFAIIGGLLAFDSYPCWLLKKTYLTGKKEDLKQRKSTYIFLFGQLCGECMSSSEIYALKNSVVNICVVPKYLSDIDINNLKTTFSIKGDIIRESVYTETILKRVSKCLRNKQKERNLKVMIDTKGKILSAEQLH